MPAKSRPLEVIGELVEGSCDVSVGTRACDTAAVGSFPSKIQVSHVARRKCGKRRQMKIAQLTGGRWPRSEGLPARHREYSGPTPAIILQIPIANYCRWWRRLVIW